MLWLAPRIDPTKTSHADVDQGMCDEYDSVLLSRWLSFLRLFGLSDRFPASYLADETLYQEKDLFKLFEKGLKVLLSYESKKIA